METKSIALRNPDHFSHIGLFSGATIGKEDVEQTAGFADKVKLVFVSYGSKEIGGDNPRRRGDPAEAIKQLQELGIQAHYYLSPETAHEWQTWRRSLKEFAPLLFQAEEKLSGTWHGQFETPFGLQTYHFRFDAQADHPTVKAEVESEDGKREVDFTDVKIDGRDFSFAEQRQFGDRQLRIEYTGQLAGRTLRVARSFNGQAVQETIATREPPILAKEVPTAPLVEVTIDRIIRDAFADAFLVGMAGDLPDRYSDEELELAARHFNAITAENCMKPEAVHPREDQWQFERSDRLLEWARKVGMTVHGHTLVWHQQTPQWFFQGGDKAVIKQRLRDHIQTLVGRYRGTIQSWDVVNEAINDGGNADTARTENLRDSGWLKALGPEFLTLAFKYAHEADPSAVLYYNDYNIESGPKHESSLILLKRLLDEGAPVHAVGIQGHWRSGQVPHADIERAIANYAALGLKVSITELDLTIRGNAGGQFGRSGEGARLPTRNPPITAEDLLAQAEDYSRLFAIFKKHDSAIERVTFWGLNDRRTWRRGQHPLLFDRNNHPKPAYTAITDQAGGGRDPSAAALPPSIVVEEGGRGPYSAIVTAEPSLENITIYRPRDLAPFANENRLPIVLWGNGACANTTEEHKNFLNEIASHGYFIVGIGRLDQMESRDERARQPTKSKQLLVALDWLLAESARPESPYFEKFDTSRVAVMGMSCGGLQAIEISDDPRIATTVVCNSGVLPDPSPIPAMPSLTKEDLKKFHGPVLYITGGPSDIAYKNAMDDVSRIEHVPVVTASLDVGHGGTYRRPHGGEYAPVALAWLEWQLKGKEDASMWFLGEAGDRKGDAAWTVDRKNFDQAVQSK
jgi:GH35 family endo-1,4-beta-xylanase